MNHQVLYNLIKAAIIGELFNKYCKLKCLGGGYITKGWIPPKTEEENYLQYCHRCKGFKAPRSHHCTKCERCVMKMDHHCRNIFLNNKKYIKSKVLNTLLQKYFKKFFN